MCCNKQINIYIYIYICIYSKGTYPKPHFLLICGPGFSALGPPRLSEKTCHFGLVLFQDLVVKS